MASSDELDQPGIETSKTRSARIYRWVTAWLCVGTVIALLLLANSIQKTIVSFPG